jgi:hypothetical protein
VAEDGRLGPEHGDVSEAVAAHRDRQGKVQEDLAGIVDGPRLPPGSESGGYRLFKATLADRLNEQDRTGL